jgi:ketosteroid isomerase-like protein
MELVANWLEILKRQSDGSWKIYLEIVNSDRPLPLISQ